MTHRRLLAGAALLAFCALQGAHAQPPTTDGCPTLPADSGLLWKAITAPDLLFCKAVRSDDGSEVFAVTLTNKAPFKPVRSNREDAASIDGHDTYWYRTDVASAPSLQVREALLQLSEGRFAHITVRAGSADALAGALSQAASVRFAASIISTADKN